MSTRWPNCFIFWNSSTELSIEPSAHLAGVDSGGPDMDASSSAPIGVSVTTHDRLRIGMLWGDFPWSAPPPKIGTLWSSGVVARNVTRALNTLGRVLPFTVPQGQVSTQLRRKLLTDFLGSIDLLWADLYPGSAEVLS